MTPDPTDRELLEKAAKAAGIEGRFFDNENPIHRGIYQARGEYYWNPLISDSEALRLAVKLRIEWEHASTHINAFPSLIGGIFIIERIGGDELAATRRAIVRAAAALGDHHD